MTPPTDASPIAGLNAWEQPDWLPSGDNLPDWLAELRAKHLAAVDEFRKSIGGVANVEGQIDADARAWRREVRDALAQGKPAPTREQPPEVSTARVEIAQDDAAFARRELAEVGIEILTELRARMGDFAPFFYDASDALRFAIGKGPDGLTEEERQRRERLNASVTEVDVPDVDDPDSAALTQLGENRMVTIDAA